ncbi:MAG TPA: hypothetical protein DEH07_03985, partial [Desulfotomaculum sp.]|nr:hypothetical protein [Desulfotomaculum sp.]
YNENGRLFQVEYPGEYNIRKISYDRNGRVDQIQDPSFPNQYWDMYDYDNNGNIVGISSWWGYENLIYDDNNRLSYWGYTTLGGSAYNEQYTYDSAGNVIQVARSSGGNSTFTYNNADQITSAGFTYDNRGNLTYDGINNYTYDSENRLTNVSYSGGSATYTYYANGLRKSKSVNGIITNYHYDNFGNLVRESNSSGVTKKLYCYSPEGKLICENINGSSYFVHDNYRGDVVTLTDEDGDIRAQYYYDPWGNQLSYSGTVTQPFRYAGYYYDEETGLYYCKGRYYSPRLRRFLTRDSLQSITDPMTLNPYVYVKNNPVILVDPSGNWQEGDEKFPKAIQDEIKRLTILYNNAKTKAERDAIRNKANLQREIGRQQLANNLLLKKIGAGLESGAREVINSYDVGDALLDIGQRKGEAYRAAVCLEDPSKALIKAGSKGVKFAKAVPYIGWAAWIPDAVDFGKGFMKGFNSL